jgi:hypothetical protein
MRGEAGYYMPNCSIQLYSSLWVIKVMASVIGMVWYRLVLVWSIPPDLVWFEDISRRGAKRSPMTVDGAAAIG